MDAMSYYSTILGRARSVTSHLVADDTLFRALLLALVSDEKHVIVRVQEDSIGKTLTQVVNILHTLFALTVIKFRLKPTDAALAPPDFLRLLFLDAHNTAVNVHSNQAYGTFGSGDDTISRSGSRKTLSSSYVHAGNASHAHSFIFNRSTSYSEPSASLQVPQPPTLQTKGPLSISHGLHTPVIPIEAPVPQRYWNSTLEPQKQTPYSLLSRAETEPVPHAYPHSKQHAGDGAKIEIGAIPQALVIAGLESISEDVQDTLYQVISDRQLVISPLHNTETHHPQTPNPRSRTPRLEPRNLDVNGTSTIEGSWPLPEDFMVVYVCPIGNGFERPSVPNLLLDRFASSVDIMFSPVPSPDTIIDSRPPLSSPPSQSVHEEIGPIPVLSYLELADLRLLASPQHTHIGIREDLYLSDLFSAARHHPHLDGSLLTARCRVQATHLLRANRALFGAPPEMDLDSDSRSLSQSRHEHEHAKITLSVMDVDVQRVFARVVQHRLRVLSGPRQEALASLCFPSAGPKGEEEEWVTGRRQISEMVKKIIDSV